MKEFIFDRLVDRDNICDLEKERTDINRLIDDKKNIVVYAKRNFGKTSLVKNVIVEDFCCKNSKSFVFFVDLMGVKDLSSIKQRLNTALEKSFKESFPVKSAIENAVGLLSNLRAFVAIDPLTNLPAISFESVSSGDKNIDIADIFQSIAQIGEKVPSLIVIDEFQDVALVDEAQSLFRDAFQNISAVPIVILGSKKHLLRDIFALPDSPLAGFGQDVSIEAIDYEKYRQYILERFSRKNLTITQEDSIYLQDAVQRQPEAINILCYEIFYNYENVNITPEIINDAIEMILRQRNKRFEVLLSSLSVAEERILVAIAKEGKVEYLQGKDFSALVDLTPRSVKVNVGDLMNKGLLEEEGGFYHVCDPLLRLYLVFYR